MTATQTIPITDNSNDDLIFFDDGPENNEPVEIKEKWQVLIVDDEPEIHSVTKLMLNGFKFDDKELQLSHAYSAKEAEKVLTEKDDFALILLDVVMESDDAGLQVVEYIRKILKNTNVRIVLRTGQPGAAPEEIVIRNYDIDGYKTKTEMTVLNMNSLIVSSLRAYKLIQKIEVIVQERTQDLHDKNTEITDSIQYAKRIQTALLPDLTLLKTKFPQSFIYYQPKDIVSGDFYWYDIENDTLFISAIDCTGHGVPGAMMSVLGNSLLNEIIKHQNIYQTDLILNQLHIHVTKALSKGNNQNDASKAQVADGMDIALCAINLKTNALQFSGAQRPVYIFRNGQPIEYEGDKFPIGDRYSYEKENLFTPHQIQIQLNDTLYLYSDGVTDQFGGPEERKRKLSKRKFIEFLTSIQNLPIHDQEKKIINFIIDWKGNTPQTDDIVVICIKFADFV